MAVAGADAVGAERSASMSEWTYSLAEAARILHVDVSEIRRALKDGWFPGRFLSNGDWRIPAEEVRCAERSWGRYAVLEPDIEESNASSIGHEVRRELSELRESVIRVLKSERDALLDEIVRPLEAQASRMRGLESEIRSLREEVEALRRLEGQGSEPPRLSRPVDRLVQEIVELERSLGGLDPD